MYFLCHFTQPSSADKGGKTIRRSVSDFPKRPLFSSSAGESRIAGPSKRLPFLLVRFLWASKENEQKKK
jgi:hypothetical protein